MFEQNSQSDDVEDMPGLNCIAVANRILPYSLHALLTLYIGSILNIYIHTLILRLYIFIIVSNAVAHEARLKKKVDN